MLELRVAARRLARAPGFAIAAAGLLALGVGVSAALAGLADAVVLRALPHERPESLVWVRSTRVDRDRAFFSRPHRSAAAAATPLLVAARGDHRAARGPQAVTSRRLKLAVFSAP